MQTRKLVSFFLVVFLVLAFIPFQVKADTATFGKTDIGGTEGTTSTSDCSGPYYTATGTGTVSKITAYIKHHSAGNFNVKVSLYSVEAITHHPLSPLATSSAVVVGDTYSWVDLPITLAITNGIEYSFQFMCSEGILNLMYDAGSTDQWSYDNSIVYPNFPDPFDVDGHADAEMSCYATYTLSEEGQDLTFSLVENLYPSGTMFFGKELGFTSTNTIQPSDVVSMSKAIGGLLTAFLSTNSIYPTANLLFNKELAFWKYDNLFNSATSTMTKAVQLTLFELFEFVKLHASNIMLPGWTALTIEIAVAIGVLALVLAICGISLVVLRRRRD